MSIYKVTHPDGVPGFKLGDVIKESEALGFIHSEYADRIKTFPDAARGRLDMADATATGSKPVGSTPSDLPIRGYHPSLKIGALSESAPVYLGEAAHALPAMSNPDTNERLRNANPGYKQIPGQIENSGELDLVTAAEKSTEPMPTAAAVSTEAPVLPQAKVQVSAKTAQEAAPEAPKA